VRKPRRKVYDLVGEQPGLLTIIKKLDKDKRGNQLWEAVCSCPAHNLTILTTSQIIGGLNGKAGAKRSCGCLDLAGNPTKSAPHPKARTAGGYASRNKLIGQYKRQAKHRGLEWKLSLDFCIFYFQGDCYYCGVSPSQFYDGGKGCKPYRYNGLDRRDNKLGYTTGNVVSCCGVCNRMKHSMHVHDFTDHIYKMYHHLLLG